AGTTADPDLVRRFVGRRHVTRGPARRWLDADHGRRRAGRAEARGVARTAQDVRAGSREVRHRGLAAHAQRGPPRLGGCGGRAADGWRRLGADMVMLYPMYRILNFDDHIETLRRFKEVASGKTERAGAPAPPRPRGARIPVYPPRRCHPPILPLEPHPKPATWP